MGQSHTTLVEIGKIFTEKTIKTADGTFCWLVTNEKAKKSVVLVHGVTGNKLDMVVVGKEYVKRGFAVYAPDLPGHGSAPALDIDTFDALGDWLSNCIRAMECIPDILIGNSFAAGICYNMAVRDLVNERTHIILACPTPRVAWSSRALRVASGLLPGSIGTTAYNSRRAIDTRVAYLSKMRDGSSKKWLKESELHKIPFIDAKISNCMAMLLETHNPYEAVPPRRSVQERITIIFGTKDNVATKRSFDRMRRLLPFSRILIIPGPGHILHFEAAEHMADAGLQP
ncbi:MAG TPA: alpha/beta hydrolase [Candidatus Saccharimonadales bacterium]|nr:alpha/beta hydrolase [Candidatus Saccharimonadales bacterium]